MAIDTEGRRTDRRGDFDAAYGDWSALEVSEAARSRGSAAPAALPSQRMRPEFSAALRRAERDLAAMSDSDALVLFDATPGAEIEALGALADAGIGLDELRWHKPVRPGVARPKRDESLVRRRAGSPRPRSRRAG